jgi:hypothetical protein
MAVFVRHHPSLIYWFGMAKSRIVGSAREKKEQFVCKYCFYFIKERYAGEYVGKRTV